MIRVLLLEDSVERIDAAVDLLARKGFTAVDVTHSYEALERDLEDAKTKLAERKLVEKAKGILMKNRNLAEDEAYRALRTLAMEKNQKLGDVARRVIDVGELLT